MDNQQYRLNLNSYPMQFLEFIVENEALWKRFEYEANRAWNRGFRHYSSRTIVEYIRHETALYERKGDFKINNNHTPWLARYFQELNPDKACLFETRAIKKVEENALLSI